MPADAHVNTPASILLTHSPPIRSFVENVWAKVVHYSFVVHLEDPQSVQKLFGVECSICYESAGIDTDSERIYTQCCE